MSDGTYYGTEYAAEPVSIDWSQSSSESSEQADTSKSDDTQSTDNQSATLKPVETSESTETSKSEEASKSAETAKIRIVSNSDGGLVSGTNSDASAVSSNNSTVKTDDNANPPTGAGGIALTVGVITIAGAAVVITRKRK